MSEQVLNPNVVVRWVHIVAAIVAVGGAVFARFVLLPSMKAVPEEARPRLHEEVRRRYARLLMAAIAALLLSGFYNYLRNEIPAHKGQGLYHGLMGVKILLAFAVFFIGSALVGRSAAFEKIRAARKLWLTVNILLALTVVALGAALRAIPSAP